MERVTHTSLRSEGWYGECSFPKCLVGFCAAWRGELASAAPHVLVAGESGGMRGRRRMASGSASRVHRPGWPQGLAGLIDGRCLRTENSGPQVSPSEAVYEGTGALRELTCTQKLAESRTAAFRSVGPR